MGTALNSEFVISPSRIATVVASCLYAYALHYAHVVYLNPTWEYYGFTYRDASAIDVSLMVVFVLVGALAVPSKLVRPSSIIVLLLFAVVYVPAMVFTLTLDVDRLERYGPSLVALSVTFVLVCMGARCRFRASSGPNKVPGDMFTLIMLGLWIVCCAILVANYSYVMRFVSESDLYQQREAGAATSLYMGYVQTYFSTVFSPALIALGLVKRQFMPFVIGTVGCLVMYSITAQRTVILTPAAMVAVNFALTTKCTVLRSSAWLLIVLAIASALVAAYSFNNAIALLLAAFLVFRTLGLPGLTFSQYHDVFGDAGYTWWSHVRGFDVILPAPLSFASDTIWPNLGRIIGDRVYHDAANNVNANLFSGDGVAAAGAFGVLLIGLVLTIWLVVLDRVSKGWDQRFALLVMFPVAVTLTNGHFFTMLLSFGGLFWSLTFYLYKPGTPRLQQLTRSS